MDVSNSTGQNTGYRVVGAGGNLCAPIESLLKPDQIEPCEFALPFRVVLLINGEEVACATFHKDPGRVSLWRDEWGFCILRSENGCNGERVS